MYKHGNKTKGIEPYVIECICLNFSEDKALEYLSTKGYDISQRTYYRIKNDIKNNTQSRLNLIASEGFMAQHLERIEQLELITKELWVQYNAESQPIKKAEILQMIAQIQPLISQYYEATAEIAKEYCYKPIT